MKKDEKFSLKKRLKSFSYAFNGLKILLKEEHNARIHLVATILVLILGIVFEISTLEWIPILFAIGFVFFAELINSSTENIADFISPEKHNQIKKVKDLAAGAVLISAIISFIIGMLIFVPYLIKIPF
ncbi:MAG: diacylglycerol kinase family protein [Flavobacteriales bacterium]|nr:diacylglycerol kinase family protein [Flavobacteriales bacterium]